MTTEPQYANANPGSIASIHRYPVKSMLGEEVASCELDERGLIGDRSYALIDAADGKVVSAKNPRKWAGLLEFQANYAEPPQGGGALPAVRITMPDGISLSSDHPTTEETLSRALGREVRLGTRGRGQREAGVSDPWTPRLEEYWPDDVEGLPHRGVVTDEAMPKGTFFDVGIVHVLTTGTLQRLHRLYPEGQFDIRRFRPNLLVAAENEFSESEWIGKTIQIGDQVLLEVTIPCGRCVMTTISQGDLPKDAGILRTAVQHSAASVGIYASVLRAGVARVGDAVRIL